jgi:LacI family transcriptional regulator
MGAMNIRKLAAELGLSVGTVSKALRDSHEISAETRRKVQELAKQHNYVPNPYASSLRRKKSGTIAVVLPEVSDHFFSSAIDGIEAIAQAHGYHTLIYLTHEDPSREEAILQDFQGGRVDGVLISLSCRTTNNTAIKGLMAKEIPVIFFDRVFENMETTSVITDDLDSGFRATSYLLEKGCRRILFLSVSSELLIMRNRAEGFGRALMANNLPVEDPGILLCDGNTEQNYERIKERLQTAERPDGIIASVEKIAILTYLACNDLRFSIPDDIKVIAFSNQSSASLLNPSLTTITQPAFEMGRTAALALFKALEKVHMTEEVRVIPSQLIIRDSTG